MNTWWFQPFTETFALPSKREIKENLMQQQWFSSWYKKVSRAGLILGSWISNVFHIFQTIFIENVLFRLKAFNVALNVHGGIRFRQVQ